MSQSTEMSGERLHALDAVRGFALLLGIVLHATMSFLPSPEPTWIVMDPDRGVGAGLIFYVIHVFRMTTFFLIAGFFGRLLFHRRGTGGFVRDRLKRIALPLVVSWPPVLALIIGATIWSGLLIFDGDLSKAPTPPVPNVPLPFPWTHLWFLYVLLVFYAATLAIRGLVAAADRGGGMRRGLDGAVRFLATNPLGLALLAAPGVAGLWTHPEWRMWFGIPTPDNSLVPNLAAVSIYGLAFGFGWLVQRQTGLLQTWRRRWPLNMAIGVGAVAASLAIVGVIPVTAEAAQDTATLAYAALYALAAWALSLGLIGMALAFLSGESPVRRYIADASYWLYIVHLPLVMALQVVAYQLPGPWWAKLAGILAISIPLMLASYHLLVRYTWLGAILNGRRHVRPARTTTLNPEPAR